MGLFYNLKQLIFDFICGMINSNMKFRRTTLIAVGCTSVLAGLGSARLVTFQPNWWLVLALPLILLLRRKNIASLLIIVFLGLGLGVWRGSTLMNQLHFLQSFSGQKVTIEGTVLSDSVYGNNTQMTFNVGNVKLFPSGKHLPGNFKISGFGVQMAYRGDEIIAQGKLYPTRGSNQAGISYAQLQKTGQGTSWLNRIARKFNAGMLNALPEPLASFALGLLVGQRSNLPQDILTQLTLVGLIHIVAVSGYNLTILIHGVTKLRIRSKYQRLILSLAVIGIFILITGFSASIVRAAIVSILSLWAWFYGRQIRPIVLISFVAALTGLFNPFYVWSDIGWYLSFLAFFGVLVVAPILTARMFRRSPKMLTAVLVETFAAQLMTLPLIMMIFGRFSWLSVLANLLIVPLVPWAMLFSAVAAVGGTWLTPFAGWFAWPAKILLTYMLDVVHIFARIPSVSVRTMLGPVAMTSFYVVILFFVLVLRKRPRLKTAITTPRQNLDAP
jgi:competence protein ComEC